MNPELQERLTTALERPHRLGMIGGELEEQLAHCASFSRVLARIDADQPLGRGADLGTGGGIPGVALAAALPHIDWTLVEIRTSRATEVERSLLGLGLLSSTVVLTEPGQNLGHDPELREQFGVVVARSLGPSSMTAECGSGLLRVGGVLVVSEPPTEVEDRWPAPGLRALGLEEPTIVEDDGHRFAVLRKVEVLLPEFPRRPAKSTRGWPNPA